MDHQTLPLRDIHLPAAIGVWPLAPGWWLMLGALVFAGLVLLAWIWHLRKSTALQQTLIAFENLRDDHQLSQTQKNQALSVTLRKLAVTTHPRLDVAGLSGQDWSGWVQSQLVGKALSPKFKTFLEVGPYDMNFTDLNESSSFYQEMREVLVAIAKRENRLPDPLKGWRQFRHTVLRQSPDKP
jgi:hypothetical protein